MRWKSFIIKKAFIMNLVTKTMIVMISILMSFHTFATSGWSGKSKITSLYVLDETTALAKLENFSNPSGCKVNRSGDVILNPITQKTWFTVLLSAYMAGKEVDIYVNGSCGKTHWAELSYAEIGHVRLM